MDIPSFYKSLYPSFGVRILAVFKNGLKSPPEHLYFDSDADLVDAALVYSQAGKNVYHACAVFSAPTNRKAENVAAIKALWVDLDVGPNKPHATLQDAVDSVKKFTAELEFPTPWYVTSGNGLHAYWPFTKAITGQQWARLAEAFRTVLDHAKVAHDSSRTQDSASILRVPGTRNYKADPRPVVILRAGTETPVSELFDKIKAYAQNNGVVLLDPVAKPPKNSTLNDDLIGVKNYPPSYAENVVKHCAVLAEVDETGGDTPYEIWWRAIGVAKFLADGEAVATHWTRHRATTGHDKHDAVAALAGWPVGPTTCGEFNKHSPKCAACPHYKEDKSPIMLGLDALPEVERDPEEPPDPKLKAWEFQADWLLDLFKRTLGVGYSNGRMTMSTQQEDGTYKHQPFCDRYWQVMRRIQDTDRTWRLEIGFVKYIGEAHKTFQIESADVTAPDKLKAAFSANEIHIYGGPKGMAKSQELIRAQQQLLADDRLETVTYPVMGWTSDNPTARSRLTGDFVLGNVLFSPKNPPQQIMLGTTVSEALAVDFGTAGSLAGWIDAIDRVYSRKGAEPYQFLLSAMLASPLIRLVSEGTTWHGIPISITGGTGSAKTTTAMIAMSIYGKPSLLTFSLTESAGDTLSALSLKMGALNNIPFAADECTGRDPLDIMKIMYMQANGMSRDRMLPNGKMMSNPYRWDMTSIITSNESLHDKLTELRNRQVVDATQARCFEIQLTKEGLEKLFHDVNGRAFVNTILEHEYGHVGRAWIQYIVDHRDTIAATYRTMRDKYEIDEDDSTDVRYYADLLCVTELAARIARRLGFITWDITKMMDWAKEQSRKLRDNLTRDDWEGNISDFIGSLHGRTIVTKKMSLGRGRRSAALEHPMEAIGTNILPVARRAVEDKIFVVTVNALIKWCQDNKVPTKSMVEQMLTRGYMLNRMGTKQPWRQISIGSGTTVVRPQAPCYELDYLAATAKFDESEEVPTNVVPFPPPAQTPSVEDPTPLPDPVADQAPDNTAAS